MQPQQTILVTGGAGCIGSELAAALLADGHPVVILDNLSSGCLDHIEPLLSSRDCTFLEGDLLDTEAVSRALEGVDIVYHLAANPEAKFSDGDPTDRDLRQNVVATYNVLEAMRKQGVKKIAFSSTSAVYGLSERLPIPEDQPLQPISLYGASKAACENLIGAFQHMFDMQAWIFRFANVVGSKVRRRGRTVISDFIAKLQQDSSRLQILGNGRQRKSYLTVSDCVDAMQYAVSHARQPLNVFNVGSKDWLTVTAIAHMVSEAMGLSNVELAYTGTEGGWLGDVPRFRLDVTALNRLGWTARLGSAEAVQLAIAAILESDPQQLREDPRLLCNR